MMRLVRIGAVCAVLLSGAVYADSTASTWEQQAAEAYRALRHQVSLLDVELKTLDREAKENATALVSEKKQHIKTHFDPKITKLRAQEQVLRGKTIKRLQHLLSLPALKGNDAANALFVLGQLYFAEGESDYIENMMQSDEHQSMDNKRVSELYGRLAADFPHYARLDAVYYMLGICALFENESENARKWWRLVVDTQPDSPFFDESLFRLGHLAFEQKAYPEAFVDFQRILQRPQSSYFDKALYQLAWISYLQSKPDLAAEQFSRLLDRLSQVKDAPRPLLYEESVKYLAISLLEQRLPHNDNGVATVDYALRYFERMGERPYAREVFVSLGDLLSKGSKDEGAMMAIQHAVTLDPMATDNPRLTEEIIRMYEAEFADEKVAAAEKSLVDTYGANSPWVAYNRMRGQVPALQEADGIVHTHLRHYAMTSHKKGIAEKEKHAADAAVFLRNACEAYQLYAKLFADKDDVEDMMYFYAEAAFDLGLFENARLAYEQVRDWPLDHKRQKEAALNAVYAAYEQLPALPKAVKDIIASKATSPELTPAESHLINAVNMLKKIDSSSVELPTFLMTAAVIQYRHAGLAEAGPLLKDVIALYPKSPNAPVAAELMLQDQVEGKQWTAVLESIRELKSSSAMADHSVLGEGVAQIAQLAEQKLAFEKYDNAEKEFAAGNKDLAKALYLESAGLLAALSSAEKDSARAAYMVLSAATAYERGGMPHEAIAHDRILVRQFGASPLVAAALQQEARLQEQDWNWVQAAESYLALASHTADPAQKSDMLINAAILFEGAEQLDRSAAIWIDMAKTSANIDESIAALWRAEALKEAQHKGADALHILSEIVRKTEKDDARLAAWAQAKEREMALGFSKGELSNRGMVARVERVEGVTGAQLVYAKAKLALLQQEEQQYLEKRIKGKKAADQGKELKALMTEMNKLKSHYESILSRVDDNAVVVRVLYKISGLYKGLHKQILSASCPKDISDIDEGACDEYLTMLEDQAATIDEKAVVALQLARDRDSNRWPLLPATVPVPAPEMTGTLVSLIEHIKGASDPTQALLGVAALVHEKHLHAAHMVLDRLLKEDPKRVELNAWQGLVLELLKRNPEAMTSYQLGVDNGPLPNFAVSRYAQLLIANNQLPAAIELLRKGVGLSPKTKELYVQLANAYMLDKNHKLAREAYRTAIAVDHQFAAAYFNLASLYLQDLDKNTEDKAAILEAKANLESFLKHASAPNDAVLAAKAHIAALTQQLAVLQLGEETKQ